MKQGTQTQLKSLTWKYFKEQKKGEILTILLILFVVWSIAGLIFQLGWINGHHKVPCETEGSWYDGWSGNECVIYNSPYKPILPYWMMYSGFITTGMWIIIGLVYWLRNNWKKAEERAKEEVSKR